MSSRRLLDLGLDPDERTQVGHLAEQTWSAGGPLFQAVILNRIEMARLLLERGADPNANVFTSGSPAYRAYDGRNPEMIALIEQYGGWIDPGSAGYARQTEIARRMLAGEMMPHLEPNDFSGHSVAEQLLWGGASALSAEIVRMALEHIDWLPDDPRWFWMLWRPVPGHEDYNAQQQAECCECFRLILARCGPHHRAVGLRPDHAARGRLARSRRRRATRHHSARRRRPPRRSRHAAREHAARVGVPVGTNRNGEAPARARRGSRRSGCAAVGHAARLGRAMHRPEILELLAAGAEQGE